MSRLSETETVVESYVKELDINLIDLSPDNARKTKVGAGLEELKASIRHLGLIQPVIVMQSGERYKLIVGQRRLEACKALHKTTIPALIVGQIDELTRKLLSFGENMNRKRLHFNDQVAVCDYLFDEKAGSDIDKIREIAADLGIGERTVKLYLGYRLIPQETRDLIDAGKLSADVGARIASGWFPNTDVINEIARYATNLTPQERQRLLEIGSQRSTMSVKELVEEAKKLPETIELVIPITSDMDRMIREGARERKMDVKELVTQAILNYLGED